MSYVRKQSIRSLIAFAFSASEARAAEPSSSLPSVRMNTVFANRWSRSDESVDLMRSTR
jgi:hypothetical protein